MVDSMFRGKRRAVDDSLVFYVHAVLARNRKRERDSTQTHSRGRY